MALLLGNPLIFSVNKVCEDNELNTETAWDIFVTAI